MRIIFMGDSTMQYNDCTTYPQTGWAQEFARFLPSGTEILNFAKNGRSTKSFIAEKRFDEVLENARAGDFAIIEFGHNDEKSEDESRFTKPFGEYKENLIFFAEKLKEKGAKPVIFSSVARRAFDRKSHVLATHGDYPRAALEAALAARVPSADIDAITRRLIERTGEVNSLRFFMNFSAGLYPAYPEGKSDNTHLRSDGAHFVALTAAVSLQKICKNAAGYEELASAIFISDEEKKFIESIFENDCQN